MLSQFIGGATSQEVRAWTAAVAVASATAFASDAALPLLHYIQHFLHVKHDVFPPDKSAELDG